MAAEAVATRNPHPALPLDGLRMPLGLLNFIEPIVGHAIFHDRLDGLGRSAAQASKAPLKSPEHSVMEPFYLFVRDSV
jgi:hypothetical protein